MTRLITRRPTRQVCRQHGREGKTQQRLGILGAILWVAGLFATSTCANTCPEKTIVVTVVLADDSVVGDEILVEVFRDQTLLKRGIIKRGDGHRGRIEIFLGEDYQVGMSLDLKVTSRLETVPIGSGTASVTLANSCSSVDVLVTKTPTEDWSCLGMLDLSVEPDARALPASKILKVHDLADRPIPHTTATACPSSNVGEDCAEPLWEGTSSTGDFEIALPNNFRGYIKLNAHGFLPGYLDLVRFLGYMRAYPTVLMVRQEELRAIAPAFSPFTLKDDRGHIVLATVDCRGKRIGGIGFQFTGMNSDSLDDPQLFILVNNFSPSNDEQLKQTDPKGDRYLVTDPTGTAIIINVPTDGSPLFPITPYRVKTGTSLPTINPRVRPNALTYVAIEPN